MALSTFEIVLRLVAGLGLILANAFFVAIEFALTRARQFSKSEFVTDPGLERAWEMTEDLELYLTSCQVGITASSIAVGIVAEPALAAIFEPLFHGTRLAAIGSGAILAFLIINLVHLTHGEQTPTYLGVERSKWVCKWGASPLYWFYYVISPVIRLGDWVAKTTLGLFGVEMSGAWLETEVETIETRSELHARLSGLLEEGDIPDERREEVMSAFEVGEEPIRERTVAPEDVVAVSTTDSTAENVERMAEHPHARFPLVGEDRSDLVGTVYVPWLLRHLDALEAGELDLADVAADPLWLDADMTVSEAIDQFQDAGQELAYVRDRDDEWIGMVTVTDALEEVMGEVRDPIDEELGVE